MELIQCCPLRPDTYRNSDSYRSIIVFELLTQALPAQEYRIQSYTAYVQIVRCLDFRFCSPLSQQLIVLFRFYTVCARLTTAAKQLWLYGDILSFTLAFVQ